MPADVMHAHARRQLGRAVVEVNAILEDQLHHAHHVVDFVAVIEAAVAHVAAGREAHLRILEMEPRGGEIEERADMVVVHMGDDDVLHGRGIDAQQGQSRARAAQEGALALSGHGFVEAGVDDEGPLGIADQPDEVVHRHRRIVRIAADEVGAARAVASRVLDGIDFVGFPAHGSPRRDRRMPLRLAAEGANARKAASTMRSMKSFVTGSPETTLR